MFWSAEEWKDVSRNAGKGVVVEVSGKGRVKGKVGGGTLCRSEGRKEGRSEKKE